MANSKSVHLLPNPSVANQAFTVAGNQTIIWDYIKNVLIKTLPDTPLQPRTFPSSATSVLLPLLAPKYSPTVLVCGGSSGDMPNPLALDDCYTINPQDGSPIWTPIDKLPNGPQTMSDGILLPDGTVLILNGGRVGSGGGLMADKPVFQPVIYNPSAPAGAKFNTMPGSKIPRLYHSVATLLPSGEVFVAGSNPYVSYTPTGNVPSGYAPCSSRVFHKLTASPLSWPYFYNNGHQCALNQQQFKTSAYRTEYRVELFSPPYLSLPTPRPLITALPAIIFYNTSFQLRAELAPDTPLLGQVQIALLAPGFHTHGVAMGQRMVMLGFEASANAKIDEASANAARVNSTKFTVEGPRDASVMPPGVYLFFVVYEGVPSQGRWVSVGGE